YAARYGVLAVAQSARRQLCMGTTAVDVVSALARRTTVMVNGLHDLTLVVVAFTIVPALAHALELPGKMRLTKDIYFEVQRIYYPGFTLAGIGGPLSILLIVWLLFLLPRGTEDFWSVFAGLCGLVAMEIIYWVVIHPVNKVWVKGIALTGAASGFFGFGRGHP